MKSFCLVDDDENVREVFTMFIEENYPEVDIVECNNGYAALEEIGRKKFDLLISDLKMPDMDGEELIRRLNQYVDTRPDHVLILTGFLGEISEETTGHRNVSYLTKPFKENVFKAFVRKNLGLVDKKTIDEQKQKELMEQLEQNKSKSGLAFIEPFIDVTIGFIQNISGQKIKQNKVYIRKHEEGEKNQIKGQIASSLGISSAHIQGSLSLVFEQGSYLSIHNAFNKKNDSLITDENSNFLGHMIKKIMKETSKILEHKNFNLQIDGPYNVIYGEQIKVHHFLKGSVLVTEFQTNAGQFALELLIKSKK